ncbi:malignant T-cell-amplified sequence 1-like [Eptesicus fuscus]|nr:malignant T-cell-amplified sequence 1-like [Eptesicus fuscus]
MMIRIPNNINKTQTPKREVSLYPSSLSSPAQLPNAWEGNPPAQAAVESAAAFGGKEVGFTASRKVGLTVSCKARSFPVHDSSPDRLCRPASGKRLCRSSRILFFPLSGPSLLSPPPPWIMFKKFDEKENVSNCIQLKTSVIKGIKNQLIEQFPGIEPWLNQIMPKKDPVKIVRCHEHIEILTVNGELLFFRQREGPFYPTLRLLHKYPFILPRQQVDKGAIKFVLSGANIMCPGLTSPGAKLYPAAVDTVVAIMAEGKQHALCVGVMKMSAEDIEKVNKGIGIENIHYLNDGLWHMKTYK